MLMIIREILGKNIEIKFEKRQNPDHYEYTPYSFAPKIGEKLIGTVYTDIGQGVIECLNEMTATKREP
jgi:UDP-glucose 4-epimerase